MKLQTKISLKPEQIRIDYDSSILLLGSCFAENIGEKLDYFKFKSLQNPFGILFHPMAIENLVSRSVDENEYSEEDVFFHNERWHCFDSHSDVSDASKEKLLQKLNQGLAKTYQQIHKSTHIIITLGTAWVYRKSKSDAIVANCHKVAQKEFSKELLSVAAIEKSLKNIIGMIRSLNEKTQVILTVSPVRHLKDGFVQNQRSKAHLITAIHETIGQGNALYFPSYEIMMDELRDYRFYESDMIHPNQLAIDYIWERSKTVWIAEESFSIMEKVAEVQKGLKHRPFNPDSEQHHKFTQSLDKKIMYLKKKYPFMEF